MQVFKPSYYTEFHCTAADCPDPCCKDWDIEVDAETASLYRGLDTPLGERIRKALYEDPEYGTTIRLHNGRCPLWREDGLCGIQTELGEDALCHVCKTFPRLQHDFGSFLELGLELSCPEAARLILTAEHLDLETEEVPGGEAPQYDEELMDILLPARKQALAILSDTSRPISDSLVLLLYYGYQIQTVLDGGDAPAFNPEEILQAAKQFAASADPAPLLAFLGELEILTPQWRERLSKPLEVPQWSEGIRNLAQYGVLRYWLQAVSDYDLVSRVKLVIVSCLTVAYLGGDLVSTAQLFSKEIENDADNVDAILDGAYTSPALTDDKLLALLQFSGQ